MAVKGTAVFAIDTDLGFFQTQRLLLVSLHASGLIPLDFFSDS